MVRHLVSALAVVLATTLAAGQGITVGWDAPTQNEDATPLTDLAGYRVYCALATNAAKHLILDVPAAESAPTNGTEVVAPPFRWTNKVVWIWVTAYDTSGNESDYSDPLSSTNRARPFLPATGWKLLIRGGLQ